MHSAIFQQAHRLYRQCRAEYQDYLHAAYARAEEACRGRLLNRRGENKGIDSLSLFIGNEARALAYASEELIDHWLSYPRITFEQFEKQWIEQEQ